MVTGPVVQENLARRSASLAAELLSMPVEDAAEAVIERHLELVATLLGRDWLEVLAHLRTEDGYPIGVAWRVGRAILHLGHVSAAGHAASMADSSGADDADRARLAGVQAAVYWSGGDIDSAHRWAEEAAKHAKASRDPGAEAAALVAQALVAASRGDRHRNLQCYQQALLRAEQADDLLTLERVFNNLGSRSLEEGRCAEALDYLRSGLEVNDRTRHPSGLAVLRHNQAEALLGLARFDEALAGCDQARALWTALEAPSVCASWHLRGDIQVARGNATQAAMAYAEAAMLAEDDRQTLAVALAGQAVALAGTDLSRSIDLADQALQIRSPIGHAIPVVAAGWVRLAAADLPGALALAEQGMAVASHHGDLPRLADSLELAALAEHAVTGADAGAGSGADRQRARSRLREAGDIWAQTGQPVRTVIHEIVSAGLRGDRVAMMIARDELRGLGVHDDLWRIAGPLRALGAVDDAPDARVRLMGAFTLELAGIPVLASAWPSRKARDVLAVLAVGGDEGMSRGRLGALIWPDVDDVSNRLSVALSHLRSVLDPQRALSADHFVVATRTHVKLDCSHLEVDVLRFLAAARVALSAAREQSSRALQLLQAAAAMHTSEIGVDDPTLAEGVARERDEVEAAGRDVLRALVALTAESARPTDAVPWCVRLLGMDPYDEESHRTLVLLLCRVGRFGEARRHHGHYQTQMGELGLPVPSWTELAAMARTSATQR